MSSNFFDNLDFHFESLHRFVVVTVTEIYPLIRFGWIFSFQTNFSKRHIKTKIWTFCYFYNKNILLLFSQKLKSANSLLDKFLIVLKASMTSLMPKHVLFFNINPLDFTTSYVITTLTLLASPKHSLIVNRFKIPNYSIYSIYRPTHHHRHKNSFTHSVFPHTY